MKGKKLLVLIAILLMTMVFATGCGVEDPTESDVRKVLEKIGAIPDDADDEDEDDEDSVKYSIKIDKVDLNDDKDRATVECTLNIEGPVTTIAQQYEMKFRLSDSKRWRIKSGDLEDDVEMVSEKLATEISEDAFMDLLDEMYSIQVGETYVEMSEVTDLKVTKHELSEDDLVDKVTFTGNATYGISTYAFTATAECQYYDGLQEWGIRSCDVDDDYDVTFSIEGISEEELLEAIEDSYETFYIDSERVYSYDFTDVSVLSHEADLENLRDTVRIQATYNAQAIAYTFEAQVVCEYSTYSENWDVYSVTLIEGTVESTFASNYEFGFTAEEFDAILKEATDAYISIYGSRYYLNDENVTITEVEVEPVELTGQTSLSLPTSMTVTASDLAIYLDVTVRLNYDDEDGWEFGSWSGSVTGCQNPLTGTWTGESESAGTITVVVEAMYDENGDYYAQITESATGETYRCELYQYDVSTGAISTYYSEGSINVAGIVQGDTWALEQDGIVLKKN